MNKFLAILAIIIWSAMTIASFVFAISLITFHEYPIATLFIVFGIFVFYLLNLIIEKFKAEFPNKRSN
jgi:hypothetical protein